MGPRGRAPEAHPHARLRRPDLRFPHHGRTRQRPFERRVRRQISPRPRRTQGQMPSHVRHRRARRRSDHPCRRLQDRPRLTQPGSPPPGAGKFTSLSRFARSSWWQVAFDDDLTGWATQGGLASATPGAPTLTFSAYSPSVGPGASSTLTWTSTNATTCSGTGFSPSGASGSSLVSPTVSTNYSITCTGSGGSTAQSASVVVNPVPQFTWSQSLPVTFNAPGIVPFGGTEMRALVFMDGSLYAGIGDWMDPNVGQTGVNAAQVLRLDSPTGSWVQDQNFLAAAARKTGVQEFLAIGAMQTAHFDHDSNKNAISPVDVLMTRFWNLNVSGLEVGQKTVTTGSSGAQGTWAVNTLV